MPGRPFGLVLLAVALLAAGLAGIAVFWAVWPRTSNTSPLAALAALVWSCTYIASGLLTWRRSRLAAPTFLVAMGWVLPPLWFLFPGDHVLFLPLFGFAFLLALLGYRYLRKAGEPVA